MKNKSTQWIKNLFIRMDKRFIELIIEGVENSELLNTVIVKKK